MSLHMTEQEHLQYLAKRAAWRGPSHLTRKAVELPVADCTEDVKQKGQQKPKASKYRAQKTVVDGITFDSKKEAARYQELKAMQQRKEIRFLELQEKFPVVINGKKVFTYRADFTYWQGDQKIIEDVKGMRTPLYRLKKKAVEAQYGIEIKEI